MKSKGLRDSVLFGLIGTLALCIMFFAAVRVEGNLPAYSVLNKSAQGYSIYRATLDELKITTAQTRGAIEAQSAPTVQVVAHPAWSGILEPEMAAWVREGGILVIPVPELPASIPGGELLSEKNGVKIWQLGKGRVLALSAASLTNRTLTKDTVPARTLTAELMALEKRPVLFNERLLFPENESPSLWAAVPLWLKLMACQLLIVAGAWFWMKGNRLGPPLPLTAETERTELEYLNAAAHFYQETGCLRLMFDTYYRSLLTLLKGGDQDWAEAWEREGLPDLEQAKALQRWVSDIPADCPPQEYRKQIMVIESLKNHIKTGGTAHGSQ